MTRINRAARPDKITPLDRARQVAAVARHDRQRAQARARERVARLVVFACFIVAAVAGFYAATDSAPADSATYRAEAWDGATVARGLTLADCMENYFNRPAIAGCTLEN